MAALSTAVFAGINFTVTIRGVLVVMVAVSILMGSVWLLLSTNLGVRVGTLMALTGLFGWITIMSTVWWIFGIGWRGADPSWKTVDIVRGGDQHWRGRASTMETAVELINKTNSDPDHILCMNPH